MFHFGAKDSKSVIFQRVHLCIWAIGGHELGTVSSLTIHGNSWVLKLDNFPEFQNVISDSSPQRHYDALPTKTNMWLTPK